PLEFRLLDYDSITSNDLIGSVYIDLNSLLTDVFEIDEQYARSIGQSSTKSIYANSDTDSDDDEEQEKRHEREQGQERVAEVDSYNAATGASGDGGADGRNALAASMRSGYGEAPSRNSSESDHSSDTSHEGFIGETTGVPNTYTRTLGGWFPIYDTMWGIRGELKCQIILQYFGDVNPFNNSSAGIQVFSTPSPYLPPSIPIKTQGFISSIVTHIDPEYHWTDSFRTPRASNEARVRVLHKITGILRRRMGRKALELGANAIVGYRQWFDFEEEEKSITGRVVGTAVQIGGAHAALARRRTSSTNECAAFQTADATAL
ncbi:hypothetical protein GGF37_007571, partial [Kickxella alabastrina]